MNIYSPSSREEFSFCPRKWWLRKNGWVPSSLTYPELCGIGGAAVGKAMEVWNTLLTRSETISLDELITIGVREVARTLEKHTPQHRHVTSSKDVEFVNQLPHLVTSAITILYKENPLKRYAIIGAEIEFPQAGKARLDVLVSQPDGRKIVFDYKCKFGDFDMKWVDREFEKHFTSEQKYTYTSLAQTDMFGIILVILQPHTNKRKMDPQVVVRTIPVTDGEKAVWYRDASLLTPIMDQVKMMTDPKHVIGKSFPHANQYGNCVYHDACIRYGLDPSLMALDYIQVANGSTE